MPDGAPSSISLVETTFEGFPAVQLGRDALQLTLIPAWGGKIASIVDRRIPREWLARNEALPYTTPIYAGDYVGQYDVGGFDECFPNVGAGPYPAFPWQGAPLPDHGEVWPLPWQVHHLDDGLLLTVHGVRLPYHLEKSVRLLPGNRIRLDYTLHNPTPFSLHAVWSSHPLFAVRPGMRLSLPATRMRVDNDCPKLGLRAGDVTGWPEVSGVDLSAFPPPSAAIAVKLFALDLADGDVTLSDPERGAAFRFRFDPLLIPSVGLWLNYGGWAGAPGAPPYYNIGLEPCIGLADRLDTALQAGDVLTLRGHEQRRWWLETELLN